MPNQDIMRRWVNALRSGEYEQGKGQLNWRGDKFCCLGVLCELAAEDGVIPQARVHRAGTHSYSPSEFAMPYTAMPPNDVFDWAGIPDLLFDNNGRGGQPLRLDGKVLANLNDNGAKFPEIADLIEREWIEPVLVTVEIPDNIAAIEPEKELINA